MSTPFHRLLTFFARPSNPTTITFLDSLRGDLSLGLNFPIALFLASIRHLVFRTPNTSPPSSSSSSSPSKASPSAGFFSIHIPSVRTSRTLLGGPNTLPSLDEKKRYTVRELVSLARPAGVVATADALGLWILAAEKDGRVQGEEVRMFQKGEIMERIASRRRGREDVLPFWRGGPILVGGHSWAVKRFFDVDVYQKSKAT